MAIKKATFDPGLTQKYTGELSRVINDNGQFNVRRTGFKLTDIHPYLFLVDTHWSVFSILLIIAYIILNFLFAMIYCLIGVSHLHGAVTSSTALSFWSAFFFSAHTLTTVGYGNIWPEGLLTNFVATTEAFVGLMAFALATGLLFGRFSRPSARIGFSKSMVVTPYCEATSLQFRIVNRRPNNLIDLQARLVLMTVEPVGGELQRKFVPLDLERESVIFFPLTWTIVHPIGEDSPLYGKTEEDFKRLQVEILIMIKGLEETFGQTVHSRHSYRYDEMIWSGKFRSAFEIGRHGEIVLEVDKVSDLENVPA